MIDILSSPIMSFLPLCHHTLLVFRDMGRNLRGNVILRIDGVFAAGSVLVGVSYLVVMWEI